MELKHEKITRKHKKTTTVHVQYLLLTNMVQSVPIRCEFKVKQCPSSFLKQYVLFPYYRCVPVIDSQNHLH